MSDLARLERRLAQAVERFERVEARLAAAADSAEIVRLGQEHAELKPLAEAVAALNAKRAEIAGLEAMLKEKHSFFITVGAGHLAGPAGVPALLRKAGYTVEGP